MNRRLSTTHIWLFFSLFIFWSCTTTNKLTKDLSESPVPYIIEDNISFDTEISKDKNIRYLFFRLYNPEYSNPLYVANLLKAGIEITDLNEEKVSHSAINFYLDDNFLGLSLGGDLQLISESCTNIKGHKYMGKCNIHTSTQMTYALPVTEEEYQNAKEFVEMYSMSPEVKYSSIENFKIAIFDITRKFFTPEKNQKFGTSKYKPLPKGKRKRNSKEYTEYDFVCSTFIAFVLINTVPRVAEWFDEHEINYRYVNVGDLIHIPGMKKLFSSSWEYYEIAAQKFVDKYQQFSEYLNN
ncbi:MAG: hypothetical protein K5786_06055 [Treponema sp.]|nr:hypothetical protein [Treponema sp.]